VIADLLLRPRENAQHLRKGGVAVYIGGFTKVAKGGKGRKKQPYSEKATIASTVDVPPGGRESEARKGK